MRIIELYAEADPLFFVTKSGGENDAIHISDTQKNYLKQNLI